MASKKTVKRRKSFTDAFKANAAQRVLNGEKVTDVAEDLGCEQTGLREWVKLVQLTGRPTRRKPDGTIAGNDTAAVIPPRGRKNSRGLPREGAARRPYRRKSEASALELLLKNGDEGRLKKAFLALLDDKETNIGVDGFRNVVRALLGEGE